MHCLNVRTVETAHDDDAPIARYPTSMRGKILQDWVTIRGGSNVPSVTQGADAWADMGDCEDAVFFVDVREVTGSPKLAYQTSPTTQEGSFLAMMPAFVLSPGVTQTRVFANMAGIPLARYVRWQLSSILSADVTFRIWMATYAWVRPG